MARGCSLGSPARSRGGAMESSFAITKRRLTLAIYYVSEGTQCDGPVASVTKIKTNMIQYIATSVD